MTNFIFLFLILFKCSFLPSFSLLLTFCKSEWERAFIAKCSHPHKERNASPPPQKKKKHTLYNVIMFQFTPTGIFNVNHTHLSRNISHHHSDITGCFQQFHNNELWMNSIWELSPCLVFNGNLDLSLSSSVAVWKRQWNRIQFTCNRHCCFHLMKSRNQ